MSFSTPDASRLFGLSLSELKIEADVAGLPNIGTKSEIIKRLVGENPRLSARAERARVRAAKATAATEVDDKEGGGVGEREDAEAKTERKEVKVKVKVKERSGKEKDSYEDPVEGVTKESDDIKGRKIKVGTDVVPALRDTSWRSALGPELSKPYFDNILTFVAHERSAYPVYPPEKDVYAALNATPFAKVKVVILGQDPYFNFGQANGFCFSVNKGVEIPPSLNRIFTELESDIAGFKRPTHGYLLSWALQGVLLLNSTLTVRGGKANSHEACGWQTFTDNIIRIVSRELSGVVFLLWGKFAQSKGALVDKGKHHILESAHPSPLSGKAWEGNKHFSKTNALLSAQGKPIVDWNIK